MQQEIHLLDRWRRGDQQAAEEIYNRFSQRAHWLAYSLLGNQEDAEEVMQDALLYALANIKRYDADKARFSTWLHIITVSRCRDRQRKKRLASFSLFSMLRGGNEIPDKAPLPEKQVSKKFTQSEVWHAIQQLSPKLREAIVLRFWAGHTYQEMGLIMGCALTTAQSRVNLAYKKLQGLLPDTVLEERYVKNAPF